MAKTKKSDDVASLKQEIAKQNLKIAELEKKVSANDKKNKNKKKTKWRRPVVVISVALATLIFVLSNIFFWTGHTLIDTNRYVAAVGPLIEQPEIQSGIAQYTTTQLFNNVDVQSYVTQALPPKAAFLAPELTSQVKNYTQTTIKTLLGNSKVQSYWYSSLQRRHTAIISFLKNYKGNGTLTVSDLYGQLSQRLAGTKLSFLSNKPLPAKVADIQITTVSWLPEVSSFINNFNLYEFISALIIIAFLVLAIVFSPKKLRLVAKIGFVFAFFMIITLVGVRVMRGVFLSNINSTYQPAAQAAYETVLKSFISQTIDILIISLLVAILAVVAEKTKVASKIQDRYKKYKKDSAKAKKNKK